MQDASTDDVYYRMGSSSMAAGPGGKSALKVGEKVEQKAAGGCC